MTEVSSEKSFEYKVYTKEEVDKQFEKIVKECTGLTSHEEIIKKINASFQNRLIFT